MATTAMKATKATAPRARAMSREQWQARSIELAEQHHLLYRATWLGRNDEGAEAFTTPSTSCPNQVHVQQLDPWGRWMCGCTAGSYSMPCGHVGAAIHLWRQINAAMSEAGKRAQREYDDFCDWLEARGY